MSVVDTSTWKPFRVGDLFDVLLAKGDIQPNLVDNGNVPLVSAGTADNGIVAMISDKGDGVSEVFPAGCLTVSMFGTAFWQNETFYAVSHGRVNVLMPRRCVSDMVGLFLTSAVNACFKGEYDYSTMCTRKRLLDATVTLPATPDGEPDWAYMETYMRQVLDREEMFAEHLASLTAEAVADGHVIDTSTWKAFKVGDLFDIQKGKRLTKADMVDGNYPFVGASAVSNGVTAFVGNDAYLHDGHCLTVCYNGSVGETFLQKEPFWASDDVNVLRPFDESVSDFVLMFVAPCIRSLRRNYGYTNKWTSAKMAEDIILLPATSDGVPDWAYMEQYMKDVMAVEALFADELDRVFRKEFIV